MLKRFLAAAAILLCSQAPALPQSASPQNVQIGVQAVFGQQQTYPYQLFQYVEPSTTTCQFGTSTIVKIPANSTNNAINTATLFPGLTTPVLWGIADVTYPPLGMNVGLSSGGARQNMAPQGFWITRVQSGFPTFYVDNPSASNAGLIQVFTLSN